VGLEGKYSNDPSDPGGATRWGISKRSHPNLDITTLTIENAKEIYAEEYWNLAHCGDFPAGLAMAVFDAAVNQGVTPAIRLLQDALHVPVDGKVGVATIEAARHSGKDELIRFMSNRGFSYGHMLNFERFGHGW